MTRKEILTELLKLLPHLPASDLLILRSGARAALGSEKTEKVLANGQGHRRA